MTSSISDYWNDQQSNTAEDWSSTENEEEGQEDDYDYYSLPPAQSPTTEEDVTTPLNLVSIRIWDINENSTHYDKLIAAPPDKDMWFMWIFWSLIMALVAVVTGYILLAILLSKKARSNPFNGYLIGLMVPDFIMSFLCFITCWINAANGHFYSINLCYFQSFYFIFGIGANSWLNALIAGRLFKLLKDARQFHKYDPPTYKQVFKHTLIVYCWAAFVASWGIIDLGWLPHHTQLVLGTACIPMDYSTASTIFFYCIFFPALMGIPLVYVIYVLYYILKQNLMPPTGKRRILTVYFFRLAIVFVIMWLPALLFLFILGAWIPHWLVWAGGAWSHLQGLVSSLLSLGKPDVKSATLHLWKCQCHPRDTDEDLGNWGGNGGNDDDDDEQQEQVQPPPHHHARISASVRLSASRISRNNGFPMNHQRHHQQRSEDDETYYENKSLLGKFLYMFTRKSGATTSKRNSSGDGDGDGDGYGTNNNGGGGVIITRSEQHRIAEDKFQNAMDDIFSKKQQQGLSSSSARRSGPFVLGGTATGGAASARTATATGSGIFQITPPNSGGSGSGSGSGTFALIQSLPGSGNGNKEQQQLQNSAGNSRHSSSISNLDVIVEARDSDEEEQSHTNNVDVEGAEQDDDAIIVAGTPTKNDGVVAGSTATTTGCENNNASNDINRNEIDIEGGGGGFSSEMLLPPATTTAIPLTPNNNATVPLPTPTPTPPQESASPSTPPATQPIQQPQHDSSNDSDSRSRRRSSKFATIDMIGSVMNSPITTTTTTRTTKESSPSVSPSVHNV